MGAQELAGSAGAEKMREIEIDAFDRPAEPRFQIILVVGRELRRHRGGGFGLRAQVEDGLAKAAGYMEASVRAPLDGVGGPAEAVLRAMLLHRSEPGLLDELEEAGGARRPRSEEHTSELQ